MTQLLPLIGIATLLASCGGDSDEMPEHPVSNASASMTVGLLSDDMTYMLDRLHITTSIDGVAATDEWLRDLEHGPDWGPAPWYPKEIRLEPPDGHLAGEVAVRIEGYLNPNLWPESEFPGVDLWPGLSPDDPNFATERLLIRRLARQRFGADEPMLLRINLEKACARIEIEGPVLRGPVCKEPETCIGGVCVSDGSDVLEPYTPDWPKGAADACGGGAPELMIGTGDAEFAPLRTGETIYLVEGPQGGHHFFAAIQMRGLRRWGAVTTLRATQPESGVEVPAVTFASSYDRTSSGSCELAGLLYRLDTRADVAAFLGKPLDLVAEVVDGAGKGASAEVRIEIAATIK